MTQNQIAYWSLVENKRANEAKERETYRSNRAQEKRKMMELGETQRSNRAKEYETYRSNVTRERETTRHNATTEAIQTVDTAGRTAKNLISSMPIIGGLMR